MSKATVAVRARRLYPKSQAFQRAYVRGYRAASAGVSANPYKAGGWAPAFAAAWWAGWTSFASDPD